jgi:predicted transcriptional regulator
MRPQLLDRFGMSVQVKTLQVLLWASQRRFMPRHTFLINTNMLVTIQSMFCLPKQMSVMESSECVNHLITMTVFVSVASFADGACTLGAVTMAVFLMTNVPGHLNFSSYKQYFV